MKSFKTQAVREAEELANCLRMQLRNAEANLRDAQAIQAAREREPVGDMIRFVIQFDSYGKRYPHLALRIAQRWYTTGASCPKNGYTWAELTARRTEGTHWYSPVTELNFA